MDGNKSVAFLSLCRELSRVVEIEHDEQVHLDSEAYKHALYKFHLGATPDQSLEAIQELCADFLKHSYAFFVSIQQRSASPSLKKIQKSYCHKLVAELGKMITAVASDSPLENRVVNIGILCELVDKSKDLCADITDYYRKEQNKCIENLKIAIDDIDDDVFQIQEFIEKQITIFDSFTISSDQELESLRKICALNDELVGTLCLVDSEEDAQELQDICRKIQIEFSALPCECPKIPFN